MKRTIIRYSSTINSGKWQKICQLARLYRDEKNTHLGYFNQDQNFAADQGDRLHRDTLVAESYVPDTHLQARQWKTALKAAYETVDKNWCALTVDIKPMIAKHKTIWTDAEMHYAYWLTYSCKRLAELIDGKAPIPDKFNVTEPERKRVQNYLRRVVRRKRGQRPVAKLARSIELDADMYSVVETKRSDGTVSQYIKMMGLVPRKQIVIPLTGYSNFTGNIKIVLDFSKQRVEIHITGDLVISENKFEAVVPLDAGVSEVFVDETGRAYEPTFGKTIKKASDQLNKTMKARNKSHALMKHSSKHKAHRIAKFNLGKKKLREHKRKAQGRIQQQVSLAIKQVVEERKPSIIVTERLDIRGKAKSKVMSRLVSYWMRGSLKERMSFLALAEGFCHQQVNPAYTSQMCPTCLFVHKDNRKGDIFQCLHCGHTDYADRVAAINLLARYYDRDITTFTPKEIVKSILQSRFIASLEKSGIGTSSSGLTVPGRTGKDGLPCQSETPLSNPYIVNRHSTDLSCLSTF